MAYCKVGSLRGAQAKGVGRGVVALVAAPLMVALLSGCAGPGKHSMTAADNWLQVQRQGHQASLTPQSLSPREQELAHRRWLDSFNHPIPERYASDTAGGFSGN
ncbi:DUF3613 domain-containing protein [Vreelandella sp. GE22]